MASVRHLMTFDFVNGTKIQPYIHFGFMHNQVWLPSGTGCDLASSGSQGRQTRRRLGLVLWVHARNRYSHWSSWRTLATTALFLTIFLAFSSLRLLILYTSMYNICVYFETTMVHYTTHCIARYYDSCSVSILATNSQPEWRQSIFIAARERQRKVIWHKESKEKLLWANLLLIKSRLKIDSFSFIFLFIFQIN